MEDLPKEQPKPKFPTWIRAIALLVVVVFVPEQAAWAMGYDPSVLWAPKFYLGTGQAGYMANFVAENVRRSLNAVANKPLGRVEIAPNLVVDTPPAKEFPLSGGILQPGKSSQQIPFDALIKSIKAGVASVNQDNLYLTSTQIKKIYEWLRDPQAQIDSYCGVYALHSLLKAHGKEITLEELALRVILVDLLSGNIKELKGKLRTSLYALNEVAASFGIKTFAAKAEAGQINKESINQFLPLLAHLNSEHFIYITGITEDMVYYLEKQETEFLPLNKFLAEFSGYFISEKGLSEASLATPEQTRMVFGRYRRKDSWGLANTFGQNVKPPSWSENPFSRGMYEVFEAERGGVTVGGRRIGFSIADYASLGISATGAITKFATSSLTKAATQGATKGASTGARVVGKLAGGTIITGSLARQAMMTGVVFAGVNSVMANVQNVVYTGGPMSWDQQIMSLKSGYSQGTVFGMAAQGVAFGVGAGTAGVTSGLGKLASSNSRVLSTVGKGVLGAGKVVSSQPARYALFGGTVNTVRGYFDAKAQGRSFNWLTEAPLDFAVGAGIGAAAGAGSLGLSKLAASGPRFLANPLTSVGKSGLGKSLSNRWVKYSLLGGSVSVAGGYLSPVTTVNKDGQKQLLFPAFQDARYLPDWRINTFNFALGAGVGATLGAMGPNWMKSITGKQGLLADMRRRVIADTNPRFAQAYARQLGAAGKAGFAAKYPLAAASWHGAKQFAVIMPLWNALDIPLSTTARWAFGTSRDKAGNRIFNWKEGMRHSFLAPNTVASRYGRTDFFDPFTSSILSIANGAQTGLWMGPMVGALQAPSTAYSGARTFAQQNWLQKRITAFSTNPTITQLGRAIVNPKKALDTGLRNAQLAMSGAKPGLGKLFMQLGPRGLRKELGIKGILEAGAKGTLNEVNRLGLIVGVLDVTSVASEVAISKAFSLNSTPGLQRAQDLANTISFATLFYMPGYRQTFREQRAQLNFARGVDAYSRGDFGRAETFFGIATRMDPAAANYYNLGLSQRAANRPDSVSDWSFERASQLARQSGDKGLRSAAVEQRLGIRAQDAFSQGNYLRAETYSARATRLNPTGENYFNLGLAQGSAGKAHAADWSFERAISLAKDSGNKSLIKDAGEQRLLLRGNEALVNQKYAQAARDFAAATRVNRTAENYHNLGVAQRALGQTHAADWSFESAISLAKQSGNRPLVRASGEQRLALRAQESFAQQKYVQAARDFAAAAKLNPTAESYHNLGLTQNMLIKSAPKTADLRLRTASVQERLGALKGDLGGVTPQLEQARTNLTQAENRATELTREADKWAQAWTTVERDFKNKVPSASAENVARAKAAHDKAVDRYQQGQLDLIKARQEAGRLQETHQRLSDGITRAQGELNTIRRTTPQETYKAQADWSFEKAISLAKGSGNKSIIRAAGEQRLLLRAEESFAQQKYAQAARDFAAAAKVNPTAESHYNLGINQRLLIESAPKEIVLRARYTAAAWSLKTAEQKLKQVTPELEQARAQLPGIENRATELTREADKWAQAWTTVERDFKNKVPSASAENVARAKVAHDKAVKQYQQGQLDLVKQHELISRLEATESRLNQEKVKAQAEINTVKRTTSQEAYRAKAAESFERASQLARESGNAELQRIAAEQRAQLATQKAQERIESAPQTVPSVEALTYRIENNGHSVDITGISLEKLPILTPAIKEFSKNGVRHFEIREPSISLNGDGEAPLTWRDAKDPTKLYLHPIVKESPHLLALALDVELNGHRGKIGTKEALSSLVKEVKVGGKGIDRGGKPFRMAEQFLGVTPQGQIYVQRVKLGSPEVSRDLLGQQLKTLPGIGPKLATNIGAVNNNGGVKLTEKV